MGLVKALCHATSINNLGTFDNILHAKCISELRGLDRQLFLNRGNGCWLIFSLCIDGFNLNCNLQHGAFTTSTIIALVSLKLSLSKWYKPENMFVAGVIPGPHSPTDSQIHHFTQLIVNDFLKLYHGVQFLSTASQNEGCNDDRLAVLNLE